MSPRWSAARRKLKRLYEAIENGVVDMGDSSLKDRITELKAVRDQARGDADRALAHITRIGPAITPETLRKFATVARRKLRNEDGSLAQSYLRAVAQKVVVSDKRTVSIHGTRSELLRTITAASGVEAAVLGVSGRVLDWRTRQDSNL